MTERITTLLRILELTYKCGVDFLSVEGDGSTSDSLVAPGVEGAEFSSGMVRIL
jgi:hypothetical protein